MIVGVTNPGSIDWYVLYVRSRVSREGGTTDAIRRRIGGDDLTETESTMVYTPSCRSVALIENLDENRVAGGKETL
jgi:hypothetical protein